MRGSRNFHQGVDGGGGVHLTKQKALTTFFVCLVLSLFYRSPMVYFKENLKFPEGVQPPGGGGGGGGGCSNRFFPIETHITCEFLAGPPVSPLWMCA